MTEPITYQNYIAGEFRATEETIPVENPATGEILAYAPRATAADVDDALQAAFDAKKSWALTPAPERATYLNKLAAGIRANEAAFTEILVKEQSKTPELANVEVMFTADYLDYMAGFALRIEGSVLNSARPKESIFVLRKPLGVAVGILP